MTILSVSFILMVAGFFFWIGYMSGILAGLRKAYKMLDEYGLKWGDM